MDGKAGNSDPTLNNCPNEKQIQKNPTLPLFCRCSFPPSPWGRLRGEPEIPQWLHRKVCYRDLGQPYPFHLGLALIL